VSSSRRPTDRCVEAKRGSAAIGTSRAGLRRSIVSILLGATIWASAGHTACAATQVYRYRVEHPRYGNIGIFTNTVRIAGNTVDVTSALHVAVELLGIPLFHEDANRSEHWVNRRFVSFKGVTDTNGDKVIITGHATRKGFKISSPAGVAVAPLRVHPSNPWAPWLLDTNVLMSTRTGKVTHVVVTDVGETNVTFDGKTLRLHEFFVDDDKHQVVWFDDRGIPAAFQAPENGAVISFVLMGQGLFLP
jgi:Domain of unknown function (DUF6134)